jgi:membrane protein
LCSQTDYGREFINILLDSLPDDFINTLKPRMYEIIAGPPASLLTLSVLGTIWSSSSYLEAFRTVLNRINKVSSPPMYLLRRLNSILLFLLFTTIIVLTMLLIIFIPIAYEKLDALLKIKSVIHIENIKAISFFKPVEQNIREIALIISLFTFISFIYYFVPNKKMTLRAILPGTILVEVTWLAIGNLLSSFLQGYQQFNFVYGGLAGTIVSMIFFFIINVTFIYGAELNFLLQKKAS